ncbi:hypothetical protein [Simkania sp.]|uniref:hypothetical protein n=1 Tax=Simkania sp. TaxID=34094 RepID=UPI003B529E2A
MASISEKLSFFTLPIYKTVSQTDDRFDFLKHSWINFSEFLCSIPGEPVFVHNYHAIQESSPPFDPQQEVFTRQAHLQIEAIKKIAAWIFIAVVSWFNPSFGLLLVAAAVGPKLVHRLADVPADKIIKSPLLYQGDLSSCTYPGGEVGVNIDDWTYSSMNGFSMIFDGVGHGKATVVEQEHPLYSEMAQSYEKFVTEFDYRQENATSVFKTEADKIVETFDTKMMKHREQQAELRNRSLSIHARLCQQQTFSNEDVREFIETLDQIGFRKRYEELLDRYTSFTSVHSCYEHLVALCESKSSTQDLNLFKQSYETLLSKDDEKGTARALFWDFLPHKNTQLSLSGPAFGVAHVFQDSQGQSHLYTSHSADIAFLIIKPQAESKTVEVSNIQESQCEWIEETKDGAGLGASDKYTGESRLAPIPSGSVVYSFTDGIGGFLSRKEILEVIQTAPTNMDQLVREFEAKIRDPSHHIDADKKTEDPSRQSACNPKEFCKKFDPMGMDKECVDDIAITCLRVR